MPNEEYPIHQIAQITWDDLVLAALAIRNGIGVDKLAPSVRDAMTAAATAVQPPGLNQALAGVRQDMAETDGALQASLNTLAAALSGTTSRLGARIEELEQAAGSGAFLFQILGALGLMQTRAAQVLGGGASVTIDANAPEQKVALTWSGVDDQTVPAFTNFYKAYSTYPRTIDTANAVALWTQHKNVPQSGFEPGVYFCAMQYDIPSGNSMEIGANWGTHQTGTNTDVLTGSGWVYGVQTINSDASRFSIRGTDTGTATINKLYCIYLTPLMENETIDSTDLEDLIDLFGGLDLVPGQDYAGSTIQGTATLTIARGSTEITVDAPEVTARIEGGDVLSLDNGSVSFNYYVAVPPEDSGGDSGSSGGDPGGSSGGDPAPVIPQAVQLCETAIITVTENGVTKTHRVVILE